MGEEANLHLTTTSFQVAVECYKSPLNLLFVQTKLFQFPQMLLVRPVLENPHQLHFPSLDTLQGLDVFLVVGAQN